MIFMLISMPCIATVAVTKKESGSWRWALMQLAGLTTLAYVVTTAVFQVGTLFGIGIGQ
jgi:ferrous iron transport protein B